MSFGECKLIHPGLQCRIQISLVALGTHNQSGRIDCLSDEAEVLVIGQRRPRQLNRFIRFSLQPSNTCQAVLRIGFHPGVLVLFRKAEGRNENNLTLVAALFDRNGNFLQAIGKTLDMKLRDATLATRLNGGISVRVDFDVTRGGYIIRSVVRDTEGQLMGAENGSVEIP